MNNNQLVTNMNFSRSVLSATTFVIVLFFAAQLSNIPSNHYYTDLDESNTLDLNTISSSGTAAAVQQKQEPTNHDGSNHNLESPKLPPQQLPADGYFNGNPIQHQAFEQGWHSSSHCIGDNFGPDAWKYRSCHFQNLCFDLKNQSWVLFTSPEQIQLENSMRDAELTDFTPSFSMNTTVSIGGINRKWSKDIFRMEWFPKLKPIEDIEQSGFYKFVNDVTLVPFHSMAGFNPGHLVWDDFLPIYTLLSMFQLLGKDLVLMRYKPDFWQWASCDRRWNSGKRKPYCKYMMNKFLPLIGQDLTKMTTQENANVTWINNGGGGDHHPKSNFVCAENGAAGLGMLTDHGQKLHGWEKEDFEFSHNYGRGAVLYEFRNWMLSNINIAASKPISKAPYKIVFSINSSSTSVRNVQFEEHIKLLRNRLGKKYNIQIVAKQLSSMTLNHQIELISSASIMVTMCGGGAVTGMFLPKGASLLTYFNEKERGGNTSPRLDWDLLNNLSYIRVHWLPRPRAHGSIIPREADYEAFISLIDHELDLISHTK